MGSSTGVIYRYSPTAGLLGSRNLSISTANIYSMVVSPDGSRLYVGFRGTVSTPHSTIRVLNTADLSDVTTITVGQGPVSLVLNADGSRLYVATIEGNRLWTVNTETFAAAATGGPQNGPNGVAVSPDGQLIYVAATEGHLIRTHGAAGTELSTIALGPDARRPSSVVFTPDGAFAYISHTSVSGNGWVSLIEVASSTVVRQVPMPAVPGRLAISPDGSTLAVAIPSRAEVVILGITAPAAPAGVAATAGDSTASASWVASGDDGGLPITGYRVTVFTSDDVQVGASVDLGAAATSHTATGLTNGQGHYFRVAAVTDAGTSAADSNEVVPAGVPLAPSPTATAGDAEATVTWSAPDSNGSAIQGYRVTLRDALGNALGAAVTVPASGPLSYTASGLSNGSSYSFTVLAYNSVGDGLPASTAQVTPRATAAPGEPEDPAGPAGLPGTGLQGSNLLFALAALLVLSGLLLGMHAMRIRQG